MKKLGQAEILTLLQTAKNSFPHGECNTCECFLCYIAQLRLDSDPADKDLFAAYEVNRVDLHKCLGCDPCPPSDLYAEYMRKKRTTPLIVI